MGGDLIQILGLVLPVIGAAGGVYAAIKGDLAKLHERSTIALVTANKAHERIDNLLKEKKL